MQTLERPTASPQETLLSAKLEAIVPRLVCPECRRPLERTAPAFRCGGCQRLYPIAEGRIYFEGTPDAHEGVSDDLLFNVKRWLKKYPVLFKLAYILQPAYAIGKGPEAIERPNVVDPIYLNLGCGTPLYWKAGAVPLIQVDLHPYPGVDLVCDASRLPFRDGDVDGVYNESLMEHTPHPEAIVTEVVRVLRVGALANFIMPQVAPFHATPHDYTRWTIPGGRNLLKKLIQVDSGVRQGPVSAWLWQTQELIATALSFGIAPLYATWLILLMTATFPIKFLDAIVARLPDASRAALTLYFVVQKD